MSINRRTRAWIARSVARQQRADQRERLRSVQAGPVGAWTCDGRTALFFAGPETIIRNQFGEVVYAEKGPEFLLDVHDYARRITATPRPLSKRVKSKA